MISGWSGGVIDQKLHRIGRLLTRVTETETLSRFIGSVIGRWWLTPNFEEE